MQSGWRTDSRNWMVSAVALFFHDICSVLSRKSAATGGGSAPNKWCCPFVIAGEHTHCPSADASNWPQICMNTNSQIFAFAGTKTTNWFINHRITFCWQTVTFSFWKLPTTRRKRTPVCISASPQTNMDGPEVRTPLSRSPVSSCAHRSSSALSLPLFVFQGRFRPLCKVCSLCEMAMLALHCLPLLQVAVLLLHFSLAA